jgi:hypothetical protein
LFLIEGLCTRWRNAWNFKERILWPITTTKTAGKPTTATAKPKKHNTNKNNNNMKMQLILTSQILVT